MYNTSSTYFWSNNDFISIYSNNRNIDTNDIPTPGTLSGNIFSDVTFKDHTSGSIFSDVTFRDHTSGSIFSDVNFKDHTSGNLFSDVNFAQKTGNYLFFNSGGITIDDGGSSPYPSVINIANYGGVIKTIRLRISGFSHNFPDDVDMMLGGPNGKNLVIMSDVGNGFSITNVDLVVDDAAILSFPDELIITAGSYKPTDINDGADTYSAPAGTPNITQFTGFTGIFPNGAWNLYAMDDNALDAGSISGWALEITTTTGNPI